MTAHETLHGKPYFLFPDVLKRWSFRKNCPGIWSFYYYWERWHFFFPKICFYPLGRKWRSFSKKILGNMIFSSNFLKRWLFQNGPPRHMIFLALSEKMIFFPEDMIFFPRAESERWSFSENTCKYDIFYVHVRVLQTWRRAPLSKKNQRWSYPAKNTPKGDWGSRLTS